MIIDQAALEHILTHAIDDLYTNDIYILRLDVAERTLCAQLARVIQRRFDLHSVHTEYNKHGVEPKAVELPDAKGVLTMGRVVPDIIIHQPGHDAENILVIEVKKSTNPVTDDADLAKLAQIKWQIGYRFAAFLRLSTGDSAVASDVRIIWV